ncbi:MAG: hypothetical protein GY913_30025 [Proteobacteria bacterium]|nr:hypothetical protein [Pseudomonadota bacterium]MCP4921155.1 hypothetical protein [Pseudomonadota bacterium]
MFLLALLSTDADACAMAYGGGNIGYSYTSTVSLGQLIGEIDEPESHNDRFEKLAPKVQGPAPARAPVEREPVRPIS